jgi:hypothetical protein
LFPYTVRAVIEAEQLRSFVAKDAPQDDKSFAFAAGARAGMKASAT